MKLQSPTLIKLSQSANVEYAPLHPVNVNDFTYLRLVPKNGLTL